MNRKSVIGAPQQPKTAIAGKPPQPTISGKGKGGGKKRGHSRFGPAGLVGRGCLKATAHF